MKRPWTRPKGFCLSTVFCHEVLNIQSRALKRSETPSCCPPPIMQPKTKRPQKITVGDFYEHHHSELGLRMLGSEVGWDREISEPTINRPGLALAGFFTYFAFRRIQVIGNSEHSYLLSLAESERIGRWRPLLARRIPCIVIARGKVLPEELLRSANDAGVAIFQTRMITMKFINAATIRLEDEFAPTVLEHGCMVDVQGIGVLIRGGSGSGKSESVLGLLDRGASLVSDDVVRIKLFEERELLACAPEMTRHHMEVRGLGLIHVSAVFGIGSVRDEKRVDMVVNLVPAGDLNEVERVGMQTKSYRILGIDLPMIELPVAPGRDLAKLIEVAALNQKLRRKGFDAALEFDQRLKKKMGKKPDRL